MSSLPPLVTTPRHWLMGPAYYVRRDPLRYLPEWIKHYLAGVMVLLAIGGRAAENPVPGGLFFRFDAAEQRAARQRAAVPSTGHLQPVDYLLDTSTNGRTAMQPIADRRPILISDGTTAYLKFDGKDDFLAISSPSRQSATEITLFLLAAPNANAGTFSAFFGAAERGKNDYTSGLNFDFGPNSTKEISVLNVESVGAVGFSDLLVPGFFNAAERPFGDFHVFTVRSKIGAGGTEVFLDGFKGGERVRNESRIGLDQIIIGARFYSNDGNQPPYAQGFFNGAIADVLLYERAVTDDERRAVEEMLLAKAAKLQALLRGGTGHILEPVKDPPIVQMLLPGFTVRELPLKIGNLNNVRYRHDGKLIGLGYDGHVHILTDSNGDGLEDKDELFWEQSTLRAPIGMALTAKDDPRGDGIFVASKGKISLLLDKDRDGRAEEEKVLATGWPELPHGVDTLGLAVDPKDGAIFFGLGCANFVDAYQRDKATGRAHYSLQDIHGTIQRLRPDFSQHETVCTGVRFTCALAFNRQGDLFATDQEGATWLSNGNPLDELLHIEPGKHYGFPPRHPKYLPEVRDQPAVVEYGPQHQSTVGMIFNEGVNGGPFFGPAHWEGDALVCGESRGKIWRTKLARTPLGYVGQNQLIACLGLLTVDACVSPQGDLIVACHSGPPDWGTGPAGEGRIFKISYTGRSLPQPVIAWAAAPDEFRVGFDRPLEPADWVKAKEQTRIEAGVHVSAGDRFEAIRPGYQVVRDQMTMPRRHVPVLGLTLTEDHRTLALRVPRQTEPVNYAITLPLPARWKQPGGIDQHQQLDLLVTLDGLSASVTGRDGTERRAVLPHPSLLAASILTAGSADHERWFKAATSPQSTLTLRGSVNMSNPFVPAVQPGAKLDWDMAGDPIASARFGLRSDYAGESEVLLKTSAAGRLQPLPPLSFTNPAASANGLFLARETVRHSLATTRFHLPWANATEPGSSPGLAKARTDVKGHWLRGRRVFFSEAGCATCHTIRGEGIAFGPDLSNLNHRDRDSVLLDIREPSATINPDQAGTLVTLSDGTSISGLVRSTKNDLMVLALPAGAQTEVATAKVAKTEPLQKSLMPDGLTSLMTSEQLEDLLTFLLLEPLSAAAITRTDPPVPAARKISEIVDVLGSNPRAPQQTAPLRILLCSGPKDHGPDEHDYPLWLERWSRLLALGDNVTVRTSAGFPTVEQLAATDVAVFCNANPGWNSEKAAALDAYHQQGGGVVYIHYAVEGGKDPNVVAERMGQSFTLGSRFRHGEMDLVMPQRDHPITRGFSTLHLTDETYWNMRGDTSRLNILGVVNEEGAPRPQLWTLERHKSRIVGCIPGHYTWTFDDPLFRVLLLRSICWAAKQDNVDLLAELALIGARVQP